MNMYRVVYYMSVLALIVNALAMIGTLLGWFYFVESKYLFWINLVLLSIFNRLKKKEKDDEQVQSDLLCSGHSSISQRISIDWDGPRLV